MAKRNMFVGLDVHKDSIAVAIADMARSARPERSAETLRHWSSC